MFHTLTYTSTLTVRGVKNETLRQKRWFQFSHCELSIHMYQHFSSTWIWITYLSLDTIFQSLWFLSGFSWGLLLTRMLLNQGFLLVKLKSSLRQFYCRRHDLVDRYGISVSNDHGYVPLVVNTHRPFPLSWLITGFVTRLPWRVSLVEQELLSPSEHLSSTPVFSGVCFIRSSVLYVC